MAKCASDWIPLQSLFVMDSARIEIASSLVILRQAQGDIAPRNDSNALRYD
ncbi:hypothetical protein HZA41_00010 [Candidatus Peregrinibacteria bacterium]|nr:hypothetical protein [Candidatus Peregrinibacteria bacterium]